MKTRLRKAMIIVLSLQVVLFGLAIFGGKTIQTLSEEYLNTLDNRVLLRKNYLQDEMLQRWSNLSNFENYIQKQAKELRDQKGPSFIPQLLETVVDRTVLTLRQSGATEIFIILEGEKSHQGIYLRDLDPSFNAPDNSDILIERGAVDLARKLGVSLDSQWAARFKLSEGDNQSDFYFKPFLAAKAYPHLAPQDLAYWSRPFRLSDTDIEILTYSMPLIDEDGKAYGVIGTGITTDYLRGMLNYDELVKDKQGAYLLSVDNKKIGKFNKVLSSGPIYNRLIGNQASLSKQKGYKNIYTVDSNRKTDGKFYASAQGLDLYNKNTPFQDDQWNLTGFVSQKALFKPLRRIIGSVIISLVISLGLALVGVYIVGNWFMDPINKLMENVMASNPSGPLVLAKTNILEIDELALAIVTLNDKVADSASKLSQIISMVKIPIGAFEYTVEEGRVFCTNTLFNVLDIEKDKTKNYLTIRYFKEKINEIIKSPEKGIENTYRYQKKNGNTCWLRIITQKEEGKILGVIEDVTDDILLKRRIEYERDHDVLTHLLNRRSFELVVREKMQTESIGEAAFVMWDLDNLKYINDTYGHEYGDKYIQQAGAVLNEYAAYNATVARVSGDEFYVFISGYKEKDEIRDILIKMKSSLYHSFLTVPDGERIRIRASAGLAWYPDDSTNYHELMRYSDFAMYEIKNKDKGNIGEFNRDTYKKDSILLHGKEELNHFIDRGLVKYAFQPIVDVKTGDIFAYEALMRPQTPKLSSPLDVIRLAQSQSKLYEIEKLTWFKAMEAFQEQKEHFGKAKIFINSIPNNVLSSKDLVAFEERFAHDLHRIVVEITENEQSDEKCTRIKQEMVARWGTHLALDDFGSGYNSEIALLILSPKYIKIDLTIVRGIDRDINRQKLVKNIISYAKSREIKLVAEGVETKSEMEKLIEFGVDYMQGYYLGKADFIPQELNSKIKRELVKKGQKEQK